MLALDLRTLIISFIVTNLVITFIMCMLWFQNRKHFAGTIYWVVDFAFQTLGLLFISLRGNIPDWMSMVLSNSLVISGNILGLMGFEHFAGLKRSHIHNFVLLVVFVIIHYWFTIVNVDLPARNLNLSIVFLLISIQFCWLVFFRFDREMKRLTLSIGIIFSSYILVNFLRIVNFFISDHPGNDYFKQNGFEALVLVLYELLFIILTYNLALMFNKRLMNEVAKEKEKFSKAFHSSPYAIILTRVSDGEIFEINEGFINITGYKYSEVVGKNTREIQLWYKDNDRDLLLAELSRSGKVQEMEFKFRKKSGEIIIGLISSEMIIINSEEFVLSSINDITKRKLTEEKLVSQYYTIKGLNDSSLSPIFSVDTNYCYTSFNKIHQVVMTQLYNSKIEIGMSILDCMTVEEDIIKAKSNIDKALNGKHCVEESYSGDVLNSRIYFEVTHNPIFNDESEVIGVAVRANDLTLRRRMEEELRANVNELERFNKLMIGRENRMVELKQEINELCINLKIAERYKSPEWKSKKSKSKVKQIGNKPLPD